jgi:hypothetical protein
MEVKQISGGAYALQESNFNINLPIRIWSYLIIDDMIILKLDWSEIQKKLPEEDYNRCIWCLNKDGSIKWKIEKSPHATEDPFMSMQWSNKKLKVFTDWGSLYEVNLESGTLSNWKHHK